MQTWVVLSDLQIPFQDERVVDLAVNFVADLKPHGVILNGDVVDCYTISDYTRDPLHKKDLQGEIDESSALMNRLAKHTKERIWVGGNHEDRLRRYLWSRAPEFGSLESLQFSKLFRCAEYGFTYYKYGHLYRLGKLVVTHGSIVRRHSGHTAKAHFEKYGKSVLVGHTHRLGAYYHTNLEGPHVAYEGGCLCRLDPEYVQHPDWQHGFAVVHVDERRYFNVQLVPIFNYASFFFGGTRYGRAA
jgi:predicted phosphodiesterase